jgi:hypothetical protein
MREIGMSAVTIQQMADRVAQLMEERLAIRGRDLPTKLRRAGRLLPRRVREGGEVLAEAAAKAQHPKLIGQIDMSKIADAYDVCVRHLAAIDVAQQRRARLGSMISSVAFGLLLLAIAVIVVLVWRGYL